MIIRCFVALIESHAVIVGAVVPILMGVIGIIIGRNYIAKARERACFGFYINLRVYVDRMIETFNTRQHILLMLCTKSVLEELDYIQKEKEKAEAFAERAYSLSDNFFKFITVSENNVPPDSKGSKSDASKEWYRDIYTITKFLNDLMFLRGEIKIYQNKSQYEAGEAKMGDALESMRRIQTRLKRFYGDEE